MWEGREPRAENPEGLDPRFEQALELQELHQHYQGTGTEQ